MPDEPVLRVRGVVKDYRSLRPLRVRELDVAPGESLALLGFDQPAAEVFVNLLTGAMLPDQGEVAILGRQTNTITDSETWVKTLDQFGLISERAVLLEEMTAAQNLAVPFSLLLDDISPDVLALVHELADEVMLSRTALNRPMGRLAPLDRQRLRLGRALALDPRIVLAEHPNAPLSADDTRVFAADFSRIVAARGAAALVMTADASFASAIASRVFTLQPATGELKPLGGWRRWFS